MAVHGDFRPETVDGVDHIARSCVPRGMTSVGVLPLTPSTRSMLTHGRVSCGTATAMSHSTTDALVRLPCIAIHTEVSQVPRFVTRVTRLSVNGCNVVVSAVAAPLIYAHVASSTPASNSQLYRTAERAFGTGRIAAHRVYQLDASCSDPQWIPYAAALREAACESFAVRVVAFPHQLQTKMTALLTAHGIATHPTNFTHELFVTAQPSVSSRFYFGLARRQQEPVPSETPSGPATRADAPCRAFFKLEESLAQYVPLAPGAHVLDVGASPGGWTDCLLRHGARVVAVDPGELTIPLAGRPVVHIQSLLEDALDRLATMDPFSMAVCDINVRVPTMAALMLQVAPLLERGACIVFTLKLGKKPTPQAVDEAYSHAKKILSPVFHDFRLVWLHANTQNERTLFAVKKNDKTVA